MKRVAVFNYNSIFSEDIKKTILRYNQLYPEDRFWIDVYPAKDCLCESMIGQVDFIIHSGGDGQPVKEDTIGVVKLYICHSHQWKAKAGGGRIVNLGSYRKGVQFINVLEDDEILGKKGLMPIMQCHSLAVVQAPLNAKVLATSEVTDEQGKKIRIIEALKYPDGSLGLQGHPEEGTATHVFYNYFDKIGSELFLKNKSDPG